MKRNSNTISVESPDYEKKSKKKFTIIMCVSLLLGGFFGFFMAFGTDVITEHFSSKLAALLKSVVTIQMYVLPCLMLLIIIICGVVNKTLLKKSHKQIEGWDGEDNDYIDLAERWLNHISVISNICFISTGILFAIITYNLFHTLDTAKYIPMIFITVIIYFGGLFLTIIQQNQTIKLAKEIAPEKKGSPYDTNFQDVWLESCDEAERLLLYQISYKTFQFMNKVLSVLLTVTTILGMFYPIGILCAVLVGIIWMIMTLYYSKESAKLENELSLR